MYHKTKLFPHLVFHHTNAVYTDDRTPDVYTKPRTARDKGVCRVYERFSTNYSGFLSSSSFHGPLSSPQNQPPLSQNHSPKSWSKRENHDNIKLLKGIKSNLPFKNPERVTTKTPFSSQVRPRSED
ncbi:hypothetical protein KQX54_021794 [Cotesia glomerata]|uniref:Uncharacterized protein n=1 Tax=Cotesia glomerata TaxID=32391 RepID=A0AAV7J816_COTGL|nr:hypothetical protein KQX54_021794 [Cotesia glomerata]